MKMGDCVVPHNTSVGIPVQTREVSQAKGRCCRGGCKVSLVRALAYSVFLVLTSYQELATLLALGAP